jgi:hypothetical protein
MATESARSEAWAGTTSATPPTAAPSRERLVLVLTPKPVFRFGAPLALLVSVGLAVAVSPFLAVFAIPSCIAVVASFARVEIGERTMRLRRWKGWDEPVLLDRIVALRLRRASLFGLDALRRGYGIGRSWASPLVLRVADANGPVLGLTVAWWEGWPQLAQYVVRMPRVNVGARTRDRLTRYGNVRVTAPSAFTPDDVY